AILPYIEQGNQYPTCLGDMWGSTPNWTNAGFAKPIKIYICPGRRTTSQGAHLDYGYGWSPWLDYRGSGINSNNVGNTSTGVAWGEVHSIMGQTPTQTSLSQITDADGTANTLFLSHKFIAPQNYGQVNDSGWDLWWAQNVDAKSYARVP